jgi:arylsulfatase
MFKNGKVQIIVMLAIGSLFGFLAASGNLRIGRQANAAPGSELPASATVLAASLVPGQAGEQKEAIVFTVRLPANAVLQIDGDKTTETGEVRTFHTPPLPATGHYAYTLKATYLGKEVTRTIHLAHGVDNTFDVRAEFRPAASVRPDAARITAYAATANDRTAVQVTGVPGSPSATTTIPGNQLPPPAQKFAGKIERNVAQSTPWWAPRVVPPKSAPNILLIMSDDTGFGVSSTFGGVIPSPTLDRVAANGLRYTNFNSTALCSPTRAAIITGRNHHSMGFGVISEQSTGFPGYNSIMSRDKATIGKILKDNGYRTSWFGKDHNTPTYQASQAGPFDQWPTGMGFDYFYGFVGGDTSQWQPNLFRNTTQIYPYYNNPGWNLITAQADDCIEYMKRITAIDSDQPFFVYYVPGAVHAPHHPTEEWIKKIHDMHLFDKGWNELRNTIFANQQKLGVIPKDAKLTPWPKDLLKEWDQCTDEEKKLFIRQVEVFAAYWAYSDHEIGRVIQQVEDMGKLDNTLIIYIAGDNGCSAEGSLVGTPNEFATLQAIDLPVKEQMKFYDAWGSDQTYPHMTVAWSWAFDTPFSWTKQICSHFGGVRQGMAIQWPKVIKDKGGIRNQFHHMIDIVPTILEATAIEAPKMVDGIPQKPIDGVSMMSTRRTPTPRRRVRRNTSR